MPQSLWLPSSGTSNRELSANGSSRTAGRILRSSPAIGGALTQTVARHRALEDRGADVVNLAPWARVVAQPSRLTTTLPSNGLTREHLALSIVAHAPDLVYHSACRVARDQRDCERVGGAGLSIQNGARYFARLLPATACRPRRHAASFKADGLQAWSGMPSCAGCGAGAAGDCGRGEAC